MAMKAMKAAKAAAPPKSTKVAAKVASKDVCRPPDDAVWWFADTRGCKSVWAVAWNYKNKIQQVMYKED